MINIDTFGFVMIILFTILFGMSAMLILMKLWTIKKYQQQIDSAEKDITALVNKYDVLMSEFNLMHRKFRCLQDYVGDEIRMGTNVLDAQATLDIVEKMK